MALSGSKRKIDRLQCHTNSMEIWTNEHRLHHVFILQIAWIFGYIKSNPNRLLFCTIECCLGVCLYMRYASRMILCSSIEANILSNKIDYRVISRHLFHFDGFTQPKYVLFCRFDYRHIDRFLLTMRKRVETVTPTTMVL